jgi:NADPH:quinone reductase
MKAVIITKPGGPEVLEIREVPTPQPSSHQVLVRVHAAGLNRADILQRQGHYPAPADAPQDIPGLEFAGEIAALGPETTTWSVGQRVFGIAGGGGQAEYIVTHERMLAEVPANLSCGEAAAAPEVFITAHDALWKQAAMASGETVLIHAVGSGVGLAAVQMARARGAVPYGTSRTQEKIERAREFGLQDGIRLAEDLGPLKEQARQWTAGRGFDVVLDLVGGSYVPAGIDVLGIKGRLVLLASMGGRKIEIDLGQFLHKRLRLIGSTLRARPLEEKIAATEAFATEVVPLLAQGKARPVVDSEFGFTLKDIQAAYRRLESNESFGKVVIKIAGE